MELYKTVQSYSYASFIEKKSTFIGHIAPADTKDNAKEFIEKIAKKHPDARHNAYAYILRNGDIKHYSDNGEPKGSAGVPILDVLQKEQIYDACVVVTRYFGGILLGGGGLVRAYSHAAKIALDASTIVNMHHCKQITIRCTYDFYSKLLYMLKGYPLKIDSTDFFELIIITIILKEEDCIAFFNELKELSNGQITPIITKEFFCNMN